MSDFKSCLEAWQKGYYALRYSTQQNPFTDEKQRRLFEQGLERARKDKAAKQRKASKKNLDRVCRKA